MMYLYSTVHMIAVIGKGTGRSDNRRNGKSGNGSRVVFTLWLCSLGDRRFTSQAMTCRGATHLRATGFCWPPGRYDRRRQLCGDFICGVCTESGSPGNRDISLVVCQCNCARCLACVFCVDLLGGWSVGVVCGAAGKIFT